MDTRNAFIRNIFVGNEYRMGKLTPIIIWVSNEMTQFTNLSNSNQCVQSISKLTLMFLMNSTFNCVGF